MSKIRWHSIVLARLKPLLHVWTNHQRTNKIRLIRCVKSLVTANRTSRCVFHHKLTRRLIVAGLIMNGQITWQSLPNQRAASTQRARKPQLQIVKNVYGPMIRHRPVYWAKLETSRPQWKKVILYGKLVSWLGVTHHMVKPTAVTTIKQFTLRYRWRLTTVLLWYQNTNTSWKRIR